MIVMLLGFAIVLSANNPTETKKDVKLTKEYASYIEKYNDYEAMRSWIEQKYKETREKNGKLYYDGEFKEIHEAATALYEEWISINEIEK